MSTPLRQSTAGQVVQFTMISSTDFLTPKTGLSIANTDIKLIFEGGTTQTSKNSGGATEIGSTGTYYMTLDATDTATLGRLHIDIQKTGALPYFKDTEVLPALVWDALYAASGGAIMADLQTIKTQTVTCGAGVTVNANVGTTQAIVFNANNFQKVSLNDILATTLTETSGQLAGGFKKFFNVAFPAGTVNLISAQLADGVTHGGINTNFVIGGFSAPNGGTFGDVVDFQGGTQGVGAVSSVVNDVGGKVLGGGGGTILGAGVWGFDDSGNAIPSLTHFDTILGTPASSVSADIAAVKTDTGNLVTRITSTLFSGITSLAQWLGLMAGKQTGNSTARTEIRATGAGSGTFDETTDSQEALRDRGDAAWTTATGFSTFNPATNTVAHVTLVDTSTAVTNRVTANVDQIAGDATAATNAANFWTGVVAETGTAQAGAVGSITLDVSASAVNDYYKNACVTIYSGTGAGQSRQITGYTGSTQVATVDTNWATAPDGTSKYQIMGRIV